MRAISCASKAYWWHIHRQLCDLLHTVLKCAAFLQAPSEPVNSCFAAERLGMERAMLEAVVANEVGRPADIRRYLDCTLLNATAEVRQPHLVSVRRLRASACWLLPMAGCCHGARASWRSCGSLRMRCKLTCKE